MKLKKLKGLNLRQIYNLCERAKKEDTVLLLRVCITDLSRDYRFNLLGIPKEYLFFDEPSPFLRGNQITVRADGKLQYFHGVNLDVLGVNCLVDGKKENIAEQFRSCPEFKIKRGTFRRFQKNTKTLKRESVTALGAKEDVLLYMNESLNPELIRKILDGRVTLLKE
jgi:hypothetical protein